MFTALYQRPRRGERKAKVSRVKKKRPHRLKCWWRKHANDGGGSGCVA
jgi:hypothetical protein